MSSGEEAREARGGSERHVFPVFPEAPRLENGHEIYSVAPIDPSHWVRGRDQTGGYYYALVTERGRESVEKAMYDFVKGHEPELAKARRAREVARAIRDADVATPTRAMRRPVVPAPPRVDPPQLALRLFARDDVDHYAREWRAHLWELVEDGQHRRARWHRRGLALAAPLLALQIRVRALLRQRRRSWR